MNLSEMLFNQFDGTVSKVFQQIKIGLRKYDRISSNNGGLQYETIREKYSDWCSLHSAFN